GVSTARSWGVQAQHSRGLRCLLRARVGRRLVQEPPILGFRRHLLPVSNRPPSTASHRMSTGAQGIVDRSPALRPLAPGFRYSTGCPHGGKPASSWRASISGTCRGPLEAPVAGLLRQRAHEKGDFPDRDKTVWETRGPLST